jgi:hypothetical protein
MKNTLLVAVGAVSMLLGSCTISHTAVITNNPVGTKEATVKTGVFSKDVDYSYSGAMKKGKISKVGIVETKVKVFIFPKVTTTITGE